MPLPAPNLDDRTFQDILDEARRRIPQYCPEWTDHNLSDPGITLLELFAWMTDLLLYRLNRVPEKNYIKFLDLLGLRLEPARAAMVDLTFRLTAPQAQDVVIPSGTPVATQATEADLSVSFATDRDIAIRVPQLVHVLACREGTRFHDFRPALSTQEQGLGIFSDHPRPDDGLYLGFGNDLSSHTLAVTLRCRIEGIGVDPRDPPLVWETWDGLERRWVPVRLEQDGTGGLNRDGLVILHIPVGASPTLVDGRIACWLRCRVLRPRPDQPGYTESPRVLGVTVESLGAAGPASHAFRVIGEELGATDGHPGQTLTLQTPPILPRRPGEQLEVQDERGVYQPWTEVPDFGASGPDDAHYVLDEVSGGIEFGPRIRSPRGDERQYGRTPPAGRKVRFSSYRSGGGTLGNVGARTLTVLKSAIPYVASVSNDLPATGGTNTEDLEHAKWRAPRLLRTRDRAVTPEDFEALARQASSGVARARCLPVRGDGAGRADDRSALPGTVRVQIVPAMPAEAAPLTPELVELPARVRAEVQAYLDDRRLLTTELLLETPAYTWISIVARLRARASASQERVQRQALAALYRYIHPINGGPDGQGWPFGRELVAGELYPLLSAVDGVEFVEEVVLHPVDLASQAPGPATTRLAAMGDGLLGSFEHRVLVA
jgi:predicted phage baseplate assembly protein